uniref:Uncharacterized protein n=1 Tax=Sus scrofa TaxID=9823 RepID=A0A4X1TJ74_PIG
FASLIAVAKTSRTMLKRFLSEMGVGFLINRKKTRHRERVLLLSYKPLISKKINFISQRSRRSR